MDSRLLLVAFVLTASVGTSAADDTVGSAKQDLRMLQGRWERVLTTVKDPLALADAARAVKEIEGNSETVTWYKLACRETTSRKP